MSPCRKRDNSNSQFFIYTFHVYLLVSERKTCCNRIIVWLNVLCFVIWLHYLFLLNKDSLNWLSWQDLCLHVRLSWALCGICHGELILDERSHSASVEKSESHPQSISPVRHQRFFETAIKSPTTSRFCTTLGIIHWSISTRKKPYSAGIFWFSVIPMHIVWQCFHDH